MTSRSLEDILSISADGTVTVKNTPVRTTAVTIQAAVTVEGITIDSNTLSIIVGPSAGEEAQVLVAPIKGQYDDMEERADGSLDLDSSDLEIVTEETNQQILLRFADLAIPKGAKFSTPISSFPLTSPIRTWIRLT